jgi:hypothetical protein
MRRPLFLIVTLALIVVACGGDEGSDESTTTVPDETTTAAEDPTTTEAAETTTTEAVTATTEAPATGGDECLVGTWVLDSEAFVENFSSIFAAQGVPEAEVSALDGDFTVEMNADRTYTGTRDEWGFSIATDEGNVLIEINGQETGTWSTDGSTLTITQNESDLAVDASVEVDGQVLPMPEAPVDVPPGLASNSEYTCSGDVLTVTNEGVESVLNRN